MGEHIFKGKWITSREFAGLEEINVFHRYLDETKVKDSALQNRQILFRKKIWLESTGEAKAYISADDCYILYINGELAGAGPSPCYPFGYNYNCIDVTPFLKAGENTVAVHTLYQGLINRVWVSGDNRHGLIMDLESCGKTVLCSDETFLCKVHGGYKAIGTYGYNTGFLERCDASAKEAGFERADFDDSDWERAVLSDKAWTLREQQTKMPVFENILPSEIRKTSFGYFIDFGKNYVGNLKFSACGKRGEKLTILCGQEIGDDGRVKYHMRSNCTYRDEMILSGKEDELRLFDFKAFRYAELVLGEETKVNEDSIFLAACHYPFELKAKPKTENAAFKKIWEMCVHTLKYGILHSPVDCPDREKGQYLGDGCYIALTFGALTGDWSLFKATVRDALSTAFVTKSLLACLNCSFIQEIAEFPLIMIICTEIYFSLTGDGKFVGEVKAETEALLDYFGKAYTDGSGLICRTDKWCVAEWPENFRDGYDMDLPQGKEIKGVHCVINAYYFAACEAVNRLTGCSRYDTAALKEAYIESFYDREKLCFRDRPESSHSSFISNAFSYSFGLSPDDKFEEKFLSELSEKGIYKLNIFGSFRLLYKLKTDGHCRLPEEQLTRRDAWLNMTAEGASTTFETWGKELKWNTSLFRLTLSYAAFFIADTDFETDKSESTAKG